MKKSPSHLFVESGIEGLEEAEYNTGHSDAVRQGRTDERPPHVRELLFESRHDPVEDVNWAPNRALQQTEWAVTLSNRQAGQFPASTDALSRPTHARARYTTH
jgi:hypothetical protein